MVSAYEYLKTSGFLSYFMVVDLLLFDAAAIAPNNRQSILLMQGKRWDRAKL